MPQQQPKICQSCMREVEPLQGCRADVYFMGQVVEVFLHRKCATVASLRLLLKEATGMYGTVTQ